MCQDMGKVEDMFGKDMDTGLEELDKDTTQGVEDIYSLCYKVEKECFPQLEQE